MEHQAKFFMRNMISFYLSYMIKRDAILKFQKTFGFTEDIWSFDSIKKDFYRKVSFDNLEYSKDLTTKIEKIILVQLSNLGTIAPRLFSIMTTLKKQINQGGNVAIYVIPSILISSISGEKILNSGNNPTYEIECAAETIQHVCKLSETRAGDLYINTITAFLPGHNK